MKRLNLHITPIVLTIISFITYGKTYAQNNETKHLINHADSISYHESEYERAVELYDSAYTLSIKNKDWNTAIDCIIGISYSLLDLGMPRASINNIEKKSPLIWEQENFDSMLFGKALITLAFSYRKEENYNTALKVYDQAIQLFASKKYIHKNVAYAYYNAAQCLMRLGDYPKSINYLNTALKSDTTNRYTSSVYNQLSNCYFHLGDYSKTNKYVQLTLSSNPKKKDFYNANCLLASAYINEGKFEEAEKLIIDAINYFLERPKYYCNNLARQYLSIAQINQASGQIKKVKLAFKNAIRIIETYAEGKEREIAQLHSEFGHFYFQQKDYKNSLNNYQLSLAQLFQNVDIKNINSNPSPKSIYPEQWVMTTLCPQRRGINGEVQYGRK